MLVDRHSLPSALAFGILIVMLRVFGSLWIMSNLYKNMLPMEHIMNMQR